IKNATPDLVKALLINTSDLEEYDKKLGWGSPYKNNEIPWFCKDNSVTLVWKAKINAGEWYYWEGIPIPPEFTDDNKLRGRAVLTAIIKPKVSELGSANYFSTRLQVALQYKKNNSEAMGNILGS